MHMNVPEVRCPWLRFLGGIDNGGGSHFDGGGDSRALRSLSAAHESCHCSRRSARYGPRDRPHDDLADLPKTFFEALCLGLCVVCHTNRVKVCHLCTLDISHTRGHSSRRLKFINPCGDLPRELYFRIAPTHRRFHL